MDSPVRYACCTCVLDLTCTFFCFDFPASSIRQRPPCSTKVSESRYRTALPQLPGASSSSPQFLRMLCSHFDACFSAMHCGPPSSPCSCALGGPDAPRSSASRPRVPGSKIDSGTVRSSTSYVPACACQSLPGWLHRPSLPVNVQ